jgi:branched-chain amino acid transport system permease protein
VDIFLQQLINGLTAGSVYAVVALGYTMVYGIIQLINFAHGEVVMIGGMVALWTIGALAGSAGLPPTVVVLAGVGAAVPACMLLGWGIERAAYRPLRGAPRLAPLITAIGISIILQNLALMVFSRNPLPFPQILPNPVFEVAGATISLVQIVIITTCVLMMAGLTLLVYRTKLGMAMRATSENPAVAGLMGIDINRVISMTFVIGAGLGAVAGVLNGLYYGIAHYTFGAMLGLKAFCGAMLGGLLLGVVEALGTGYIGEATDLCHVDFISSALAERCAVDGHVVLFGSNYQYVFAFAVLIVVLVFRPSGLLGERVSDRA